MSGQSKLLHIPLSKIRTNPVALRAVNKETVQYAGLVDSIRKVGVLNPVNVREIPNDNPENPGVMYGLCDGLHRYTAATDAGLLEIPAQVLSLDDAEILEAQIIANYHTIKTAPVEFAKQLQRMIAGNPALVTAEVASRLGVSPAWVNERLGLPRLIPEIQTLVDDGQITLTNAFALSKLDASIQPDFVERAMTQPPGEFVPAAQSAMKEWAMAKRQGRDPNVDTFKPIVKLQKMAILNQEVIDGKIGAAMIAKHEITTPAQAWALAMQWVLHSDKDSIAVQREKHTARLADNKKRKDEAKAEREKKASEKAGSTASSIMLAPGVVMTKPSDAPVHV